MNGHSRIPVATTALDNRNNNRNSINNKINGGSKQPDGSSSNKKKPTDINTSLEQISPWLVGSDAGTIISGKTEKEKSKIPQLKTVITTEL